ncbi:MAG: hypothetical protein RBS80_17595 [Thermoguttaceae bacterium]|jgi:hypothetical protein|nr:hypothetical protein [Thermoguttaceae bacterium]
MTRKLPNPRAEDEAGRQDRKGYRLLWLCGAGIAALVAAVVYVDLGHSAPGASRFSVTLAGAILVEKQLWASPNTSPLQYLHRMGLLE